MCVLLKDSYANAIYSGVSASSSSRKYPVRKQGSYEAAVESGLKAEEAIRRSKELHAKMKKQVRLSLLKKKNKLQKTS